MTWERAAVSNEVGHSNSKPRGSETRRADPAVTEVRAGRSSGHQLRATPSVTEAGEGKQI
jgi:hypothetical protein